MLTRKQFKDRMNFIKEYEARVDKFDHALKEFAPSDFTGFYDETIFNHLLKNLQEDMDDEYDTISWWMCDTEWGSKKNMCKITVGEKGDTDYQEWDILTLDDLYDYLATECSKTPSKDQLQTIVKAQDSGVKFALRELELMKNTNQTTHNDGWEDRDALLDYAQSKIKNEYRFERGIGADLNYDKDFYIISILEDEN